MTRNEFTSACVSRTISPEIALENENIVKALADKDDQRVIHILDTEF